MKFCTITLAVMCNFIFTTVSHPTDGLRLSSNETDFPPEKVPTDEECSEAHRSLINGICYTLGTRGPCEQNELLLSITWSDESGCRPNPCEADDQVWWPRTERCENTSWILSNDCRGDNKTVILDGAGSGMCVCDGDQESLRQISAEATDCDKVYADLLTSDQLRFAIGGFRSICLTGDDNKCRDRVMVEPDEDDDLGLLREKKRSKQMSGR